MTSPTHDQNPEFSLMDRTGAKAHSEGVVADDQPDRFSLVPYLLPVRRILFVGVGHLVLLLLAETLFTLVIQEGVSDFFRFYIPASIGAILFLVVVVCAYSYLRNKQAHRIGPLLVYDKESGSVSLPRQNELFTKDQIAYIQVLTAPGSGRFFGMQVTEINLITRVDGRLMRWPILGKMTYFKRVESLINKLMESTDLPVMRYRKYRRKWKMRVDIWDMRVESEPNA